MVSKANTKRRLPSVGRKGVKAAKPSPASLAAMLRSNPELDDLVTSVARSHRNWIRENPDKTIGELKERIDLALDQCLDADPDETIMDRDGDIPEPLASELAQWGEDPETTFGDRDDDLEELANNLDALIEEVGPTFKVKRLPKPR